MDDEVLGKFWTTLCDTAWVTSMACFRREPPSDIAAQQGVRGARANLAVLHGGVHDGAEDQVGLRVDQVVDDLRGVVHLHSKAIVVSIIDRQGRRKVY